MNATEKIKMICLPYAGGNRFSYRIYHSFLPDFLNLHTVDYPGHTTRMNEPLCGDIHLLVNDVYRQVVNQLSEPYVIYGHSMGALLGYLLTKKIIEQNKPLPLHLFVSGFRAPSVRDVKPPKHLLSQKKFFEELRIMGGMPEEILQNNQLMLFFEPILRADFRLLETYVYQKSDPFNIAVTVMMKKDSGITDEEILKWQDETENRIEFIYFDGAHFFILEHPQQVIKEITLSLKTTNCSIDVVPVVRHVA